MPLNPNNPDFSQRTAAEDDDPLNHPMIRGLRRVLPYAAITTNRVAARQHIEGTLAAMGKGRPVQDPQTDQDFSARPTAETTEAADVPKAMAVLRQNFPHWSTWNDDVRTKNLQDWMTHQLSATQAESEVSRVRQTSGNRGQATHGPKFVRSGDPDHEFLDNPSSYNRKL